MSQEYYPSLSDLVRAEAIPGDFEAIEDFIQTGIDLVLNKIWYKNLVIDVSNTGEIKHYSLDLLTKKLSLPLFGSGMNLVFFRDSSGSLSSFPIVFEWSWPVYKYIEEIIEEGFSYAPEAFVEILFRMTDIKDEKEFFGSIVDTFLNDGDDAYQSFLTALSSQITTYDNGNPSVTAEINNITTQLSIIETEVSTTLVATSIFTVKGVFDFYETNPTLFSAIDSIKNSIDTLSSAELIDIDIFGDIVRVLLGELSNLDEKFKRLERLFKGWLGEIDEQDLRDLLIPQFALELQDINMALEFPRKWLVPALESPPASGNYIENPDETKLAALEFTVGNLKFSTKKGFEFENQSAFTFERAYIGKTGIMLEFTNLKVDMSKAYNIPEADADGRPEDFQGVYAESASITLPAKWFKDPDGTNAEIYGKNLLIGTGGLSGEIGLNALGGDNMFWANIGSSDGFKVGFEHFDIQFKQNKVLSSNIKGAMEIKKFVYPDGHPNAGDPVTIGIEGHIHDNGDFNLTASAAPPYPIELPDVFVYHIKSLELGRQDDDFYIGTSGQIEFQGFLKDTLKLKAIDIESLRIYSDGSIEFSGGSIALVEPIVLALGPVEITVSAIHYGSHQKEVNGIMRKFNYFGFDGGISVDPLGIEIRGDGVKFYYCVDDLADKPSSYLHIQTLYLDLTIPSSTPVAIINGWLSIPEPGITKEYAGGIKLQLPQAKISGSADMKLMPKYPAFIIDASIELPAPIPLGPVGIFGFRGLIGYRYVAEKEAAGLVSGVDTWYDYYKKAPRGIHVTKFNGPDRSKAAGTPFSIGAGASLGTSADNGTILNIKAMVLLSIPSLFMIDGRAAILSARLGLEDPGDPPFFAFIAIGDNSLELGFGADFKMPTSSGDILKLYADVQAGFFFNDSSKWYVNVGTKTNPVTARVLTLVTITSFVMLSAKGIEAGARGEFDFYRAYGPIKVHAWAYIEVGGKISFEKPQFGAYLAAGVGADIDIKVVSLYASFDILFGVEAPKPFLIYGEFRFCVKIKIAWIFKFKFCGNLSVSWEFNSSVDRSPINPMINPANAGTLDQAAKGVNMLSNETFELAYLGAAAPIGLPSSITQKIIPIDTYIDIKSEKGLIPSAISSIIGGVNNPPIRYAENVPPEKIIRGKEVRQVKHEYSIESIELKSWNPGANTWQTYHPYKALYPADPTLDTLRIGQFQKTDGQYSTIRLLATTPFSYTEQGEPGWYIPEQYGVTAASLFCEGEHKTKECSTFLDKPVGQEYHCYDENHLFYANEVAYFLLNKEDEDFAEVTDEVNVFSIAKSLQFKNSNTLQIRLPEPSVEVELKLTTNSQGVKIRYYASLIDDTAPHVTYGNPDVSAVDPTAPYEVTVNAADLSSAVLYNHPEWLPVTRIEVVPKFPNQAEIDDLLEQIATIIHNNNLIELGLMEGEIQSTADYEAELALLYDLGCTLIEGEKDDLPEGCSPANLCALYDNIAVLIPCLLTDPGKDGSWDEVVIPCANSLNALLEDFDHLNPECRILSTFRDLTKSIESFIAFPDYGSRDLMMDELSLLMTYLNINGMCDRCTKDYVICALYQSIFDIRNNCLPHPKQIVVATLETYVGCFDDILNLLEGVSIETLGEKIHIINNFKDEITVENYQLAWEALQFILDLLDEKGNCNCDQSPRNCYTLFHQVCWLSIDAYQFNINIPGQAAIEEDAQATIDGITQYIQPLWRPDTSYYVRFVLKDVVDGNVGAATSYPFTYGFSTAGPVGYFHTHPNSTYGDYLDGATTIHDAIENPDKYALTSIRRYIDYSRSYPNADGNLLSAKPLFFNSETTRIDLFFVKAYATHFFQGWPAYNGLAAVDGRIKIVIKDPREDSTIVNPPYLDYDPADTTYTNIPQTIETWADDPDPLMPHVFDQYANLFEDNDCIATGGDTIIPKSSYLTIVPKHLKPLKLYTAIVNNLYDLDNDGTFVEADGEIREVHKFNFQTSRYPTFKAQVNSYILSRPEVITRGKNSEDLIAAYTVSNIQAAFDTIEGTPNAIGDTLIPTYPNKYDRVVEGIFGLTAFTSPALEPAFKLIRDSNNGDEVIAVIILNPTPFNSLKVPAEEVLDLIRVLDLASELDTDYEVALSDDYTQAIIMHSSLAFTGNLLHFKFEYPITKEARFDIKKELTSAEIQAAYDTIIGVPNVMSDSLVTSYQHAYDRIVEGILGFNPVDEAISTEFNLVKNTADSDKIIAIIIRNPEPFNNPKLPISEVLETIQVLTAAGMQDTNYKILFSKDYSQAIIMRNSLEVIPGLFDFKFHYKLWNGSNYVIPSTPQFSTDEVGTIVIEDLDIQ